MNRCKKCGHGRISGPYYKNEHGVEELRYHCLQCGYAWSAPTLDRAQEMTQAARMLRDN